jgi:hypothetical protein
MFLAERHRTIMEREREVVMEAGRVLSFGDVPMHIREERERVYESEHHV